VRAKLVREFVKRLDESDEAVEALAKYARRPRDEIIGANAATLLGRSKNPRAEEILLKIVLDPAAPAFVAQYAMTSLFQVQSWVDGSNNGGKLGRETEGVLDQWVPFPVMRNQELLRQIAKAPEPFAFSPASCTFARLLAHETERPDSDVSLFGAGIKRLYEAMGSVENRSALLGILENIRRPTAEDVAWLQSIADSGESIGLRRIGAQRAKALARQLQMQSKDPGNAVFVQRAIRTLVALLPQIESTHEIEDALISLGDAKEVHQEVFPIALAKYRALLSGSAQNYRWQIANGIRNYGTDAVPTLLQMREIETDPAFLPILDSAIERARAVGYRD
jgi:hypothetical protein